MWCGSGLGSYHSNPQERSYQSEFDHGCGNKKGEVRYHLNGVTRCDFHMDRLNLKFLCFWESYTATNLRILVLFRIILKVI